MLSTLSTFLFMVLGLAATAAGAYFINRIWNPDSRRKYNDAIGCQLNVLGTTYAVVLGFMLFNVWSEFRLSSLNTSTEAATVLEIYRFAAGAAPQARQVIQQDLHSYVDEVIRNEWPVMRLRQQPNLPVEGDRIITETLGHLEGLNETAKSLDSMESSLVRLQELRRLREEEYQQAMPSALWIILLSGAVLVVISGCLLGGQSRPLYYIHVLSLSVVILAILTAIADIDHPFSGSVTVSPVAFEHVRALMR